MGVPALFRWLSNKYSKIVSPVIEEQKQVVDGQEVPIDITKPNPNGFEYDNLYLDMNGIVHPCSHPEDRPPPANEEEMMLEIFKYTDRVFNMVRPRKLLMIAVDGVAPRAKMNQQRSRRFRSAQEAKEKDQDNADFLKLLQKQNGGSLPDGKEDGVVKKTWDSNQITPGTPFMHVLATSLRWWCAYKINTDPGWENVKVIISDASVPGEGEHKIMEFIRSQRSSPSHDPNTRHVLYGLDADLIMLGLATHEPHFHVLREDVFFQEAKARTCRLCGQAGHKAEECTGTAKPKEGEFDEKDKTPTLKPFIWLHVSVLREYLAVELSVAEQPFAFDLERALDDWVFMCFFVGNDFLPHLPSLDIKENGIDTLIKIWRDNLPLMGGYLTKDGHVDLGRCQLILTGLAKEEDGIFRRRRNVEERREANAKRRKIEEDNRKNRGAAGRKSPDYTISSQDAFNQNPLPLFAPGKGAVPEDVKKMTHEMAVNRGALYKADAANKSAAAALKSQLTGKEPKEPSAEPDLSKATAQETDGIEDGSTSSTLGKRKANVMEDGPSTPGRNTPVQSENTEKKKDDDPPPDTVRLWEDGYAERYYEQKFNVDPKDIAFRNKVAESYVEGLAWVLLYYFQGCPSWRWYYPYHYAPFAADFVDLDRMDIKFEQAEPLKPYEQLMGVLPAASNQAIPPAFRPLMEEEDSEIIDFYPEDFHVDLNGKKWAWQGVAILPFIDEKRLLDAMAKKYPLLSKDEAERNEMGKPVLIFSDRHPMFTEVASNFFSKRQGAPKMKLDPKKSHGLAGKVEKDASYVPQSPLAFPLTEGAMPTLDDDRSVSVHYEMPESHYQHKSMLLNGVKLAVPSLNHADIEATRGRALRNGRGGSFRGGGRGGGRGGRGGQSNYGESRTNPFAQHLQPGFVPPHSGNGNGYHQQSHGYGQGGYSRGGYNGSSNRGNPSNGHIHGNQAYAPQYNNGGYPGGPGPRGGYDRGPPPPPRGPPRHYYDNSAPPPPPPGHYRYR